MDIIPGTNGSRTILYFLADIAAGATIALLTAPQSGRETRRKLKQVKDDLTDKTSRVGSAIGEAYRRATEAGKEGFVHTLNGAPAKPSRAIHGPQH
jgi:YtxH-like protein